MQNRTGRVVVASVVLTVVANTLWWKIMVRWVTQGRMPQVWMAPLAIVASGCVLLCLGAVMRLICPSTECRTLAGWFTAILLVIWPAFGFSFVLGYAGGPIGLLFFLPPALAAPAYFIVGWGIDIIDEIRERRS